MATQNREELLAQLENAIRIGGQGGKITAQDLRGFLTTLIDELLERTQTTSGQVDLTALTTRMANAEGGIQQLGSRANTWDANTNTVSAIGNQLGPMQAQLQQLQALIDYAGSGGQSIIRTGGYREVRSIDERDALPMGDKLLDDGYGSGARRLGMLVVVTDDANPVNWITWRLEVAKFLGLDERQRMEALASNDNWVPFSIGDGCCNYQVVASTEDRDQLKSADQLHSDGLGAGQRRLGMLVLVAANDTPPVDWQTWRLDIPKFHIASPEEKLKLLSENSYWARVSISPS